LSRGIGGLTREVVKAAAVRCATSAAAG
jgi:hypothetical protein